MVEKHQENVEVVARDLGLNLGLRRTVGELTRLIKKVDRFEKLERRWGHKY